MPDNTLLQEVTRTAELCSLLLFCLSPSTSSRGLNEFLWTAGSGLRKTDKLPLQPTTGQGEPKSNHRLPSALAPSFSFWPCGLWLCWKVKTFPLPPLRFCAHHLFYVFSNHISSSLLPKKLHPLLCLPLLLFFVIATTSFTLTWFHNLLFTPLPQDSVVFFQHRSWAPLAGGLPFSHAR